MKLLGLRVTRTGTNGNAPWSHIVWSGTTVDDVESHKKFIMTTVHVPDIDGDVIFEEVSSELIINEPGVYECECGSLVEISGIGKVDCYGYKMKTNARGKLVRGKVCWFYRNGASSCGKFQIKAKV